HASMPARLGRLINNKGVFRFSGERGYAPEHTGQRDASPLGCLFSVPRETCSLGQNTAAAYNRVIVADSIHLDFGI
ncbi:MAG: hypothetical protein ACLGGW_07875, partial [Gammaproteobacteria bacterium]